MASVQDEQRFFSEEDNNLTSTKQCLLTSTATAGSWLKQWSSSKRFKTVCRTSLCAMKANEYQRNGEEAVNFALDIVFT